jgi:KaiC/GvpD/RAD55 family RecA-like ATPase
VAQPSVDVAGFYAGVDVIPAHVSAGFDVVRPEETTAILEGLSDRRDVVIVGPSGSGKSALLWRSAHLVRQGVRIVRVLRVATPEEAELLVRHVQR